MSESENRFLLPRFFKQSKSRERARSGGNSVVDGRTSVADTRQSAVKRKLRLTANSKVPAVFAEG